MLVGIAVIIVAFGRLYWTVNELNLVCAYQIPDCEAQYLEDHHLDIWDAIF
jgi:hypothetical protein